MQLIMNVDDVGIHPAVRRAVDILSEKGVVTSCSLVATGMDAEQSAGVAGISVGVHLDVLRGRPLCHWQGVNTLVDRNGAFLEDPVALFRRYAKGKVSHEHMEREWCAQIERVMDWGVKPTHLSSYKQVHAWPSLTHMAGKLARRYGIGWVRKPVSCAEVARLETTGFKSKFSSVCGFFDRETEAVACSDLLWSGGEADVRFSPDGLVEFLQTEGGGLEDVSCIEVQCCPGVTIAGDPPIPANVSASTVAAIWRGSFKTLAEDDWLGTMERCGLHLVGYAGLVP